MFSYFVILLGIKRDTNPSHVKESFTQCEEYNFRTGTKISANHLASSCWEEPIIDKIGLSGMFSLCVLGKPYILGRCEP